MVYSLCSVDLAFSRLASISYLVLKFSCVVREPEGAVEGKLE